MIDRIRKIAEEIEPELVSIRRELHRHPELGVNLPMTHDIISRELKKIPNLEVREHQAEGYGIVALMYGERGGGKTVLLRADIDALPIEETGDLSYKSENRGCMHACGHDGHAAWIIGAAKILGKLRSEWGGCVKFVFQPGEEVGKGAGALICEDKVLETPPVDMAFAAHGWPSVESGKIGIARRYAFGCVGSFRVKITGKKGHASWPEQTMDPIAAANEIYQHIPAILTRKMSGTDSKVMSVTYMQAGDTKVRNIIPETCEFGGTMRAVRKESLVKMGEELRKEVKAVCEVCGASYETEIKVHGGSVENAPELVEPVRKTAEELLGKDKAYIIEEDNLGGENFAEYSSLVPSVYMFVGIRPCGKDKIPGLHSPNYRFDDSVLARAAGTFAAIAYRACRGELGKLEEKNK